ncbi:hypothetical protein ARALYDRAFT_912981 [Arabidopsis lyrata subsp. lyrata]|uniref:Uncharacterized protein n=1 Tax=Arabidopsis lyrata subsp. lyrata TaxID=81972 RepID=D7MF47_ARALL|nr:hypothetical protein ARALYDRAFT_912981 [Arabidopsis lyrata subsp. lyrata]
MKIRIVSKTRVNPNKPVQGHLATFDLPYPVLYLEEPSFQNDQVEWLLKTSMISSSVSWPMTTRESSELQTTLATERSTA